MFISIHIPKTSGTTLAYLFDQGSGRRIMFDYSDDYTNVLIDDLDWWTTHKPFIERQFDFIHGHFFYRKYAELFPDAVYITCLRHPVERIISHYNHVYYEADMNDWQYQAIAENDLDPVEFAALEGVFDAQSRHLEGRAIENYDYVFITEWLLQSFHAFQLLYRFPRRDIYEATGRIPELNVTTRKVEITQAMRERIYEIAQPDVELYIRGCRRAEGLIRESRLLE